VAVFKKTAATSSLKGCGTTCQTQNTHSGAPPEYSFSGWTRITGPPFVI